MNMTLHIPTLHPSNSSIHCLFVRYRTSGDNEELSPSSSYIVFPREQAFENSVLGITLDSLKIRGFKQFKEEVATDFSETLFPSGLAADELNKCGQGAIPTSFKLCKEPLAHGMGGC